MQARRLSGMLFIADRHEAPAGAAWGEAAARAAIAAIVADACAAFDPEALWPTHPRDVEPGDPALPVAALYQGAAGVIWALERLRRAGLAAFDLDFVPVVDGLIAHNHRFIDALGTDARSYLLGDAGVLLLQWQVGRSPAVADALFALVEGNLHNPTQEALYGSSGTMVAALHMAEASGEARWPALLRTAAQALFAAMHPAPGLDDVWIWTQDLHGRRDAMLGAGHGFAGNVYPFVRAARWLPDSLVDAVEARALRTLEVSALREAGAVNWEPTFDLAAAGLPSKRLMQDCHGAPGIVCRIAGCRSPALRTLLLEGAEAVWRAGPLSKGPGLCHGTAGNGYALLKGHAMTGDALWLARARAFAMHAAAQVEQGRREHGRGRHTLWTGDLGVAMLLASCLSADARFPTLDDF